MILVTGATGHLGHHVIRELLKKVPANQVIAAVRNPAKAEDLRALGTIVREADYNRPETWPAALAGAEKLLLISSSEIGQRAPQHRTVIEAAKKAGVKLLAYTSVLRADASKLGLAAEHKATEEAIRASGIPYVFLRNGWYFENQTENLAPALQYGVIMGCAGDGRFASASRADYAAAAVKVLTSATQEHANKIYELAGDQAFTLTELASEVSEQSGKPVKYQNMPEAEYEKALLGFGLPAPLAHLLADSDTAASNGALDGSSNDLRALIGRPSMTLAEAVRIGLKSVH